MCLRKFCVVALLLSIVSVQQMNGQTAFYWVGGSGDWNDFNHWSDVSGGAGGAGIPNDQIDAIFDAASFTGPNQVVTVNSARAFCNDFDWSAVTNTPTFEVVQNLRIQVGGSHILSTDMVVNILGELWFAANTPETIQNSGHMYDGNVVFNGPGGEWTLVDELNLGGSLNFEAGSFFSSNRTITANSITSITTEDVLINLSESFVFLGGTPGAPPTLVIEGDNITFEGGTIGGTGSTINFFGGAGSGGVPGQVGSIRLSGDGSRIFGTVSFATESASLRTVGGDQTPVFNVLNFDGDGLIIGNHTILTLSVANNSTLLLENGSRQALDDLIVNGPSCEGDARILYQNEGGNRATLDLVSPALSGPFYFRGIDFAFNGQVTAVGAYDGGNNSDNLEALEFGTDVYWVNEADDGRWDNPLNWSTTSGGPGGACIPKAADNVFFDEFSFPNSTSRRHVESPIPVILNSLTFTSFGFTGDIQMPSLTIIGQPTQNNDSPGLYILQSVILNITDIFLFSTNRGGNSNVSESVDNLFVDVIDGIIENLHLDGEPMGRIKLLSDLNIRGDITLRGEIEFDTQGFMLSVDEFTVEDQPVFLDIDSSIITIRGTSTSNVMHPLTLLGLDGMETDKTHWIFENDVSGFTIDMGTMGDVTFTNQGGSSTINVLQDVGINRLTFMNDGFFNGMSYDIDSLIFTGDHRYQLGTNTDVSVNEYFEGLGESCATITFETSGSAFNENFTINPAIETDLQYLIVSNIDVQGGRIFAGPGSVDGGNTSGWDFPSMVDNEMERNRLGDNIVACSDSIIVLRPYEQSEISAIEWTINLDPTVVSTSIDFQVPDNATEVSVVVMTTNGCPAGDTILVSFSPEFSLVPMSDRDVCQGAFTTLDPGFTDASATFEWSTSDMMPTIDVNSTGVYTVEVNRGGCVERDTVEVTRIDLEDFSNVFRGMDSLALCDSETETFSPPNFTNANFNWNTGATSGNLEVSSATIPADGTYSIVVNEGACTDSLELFVQFDAAITQVLTDMSDTTICLGSTFVLETIAGFDSVMWNTGESSFSISASPPNDITYVATGYRGACDSQRERNVFVTDIGSVDLGADLTVCEVSSEALQLIKPSSVDDTYDIRWIEASSSNVLSVTDTLNLQQAGGVIENYVLETSFGECSTTDTVEVTVEVAPTFDIGADTTICAGSDLDISISQEADVVYNWSTGDMGTMINVSTTDTFRVSAERGRCLVDTFISVTVLDLGSLNLGSDTTLCMGEALTLDATLSGNVSYDWAPMNLGSTFNVISADEYRVTVSAAGCEVSDTIMVEFDNPVPFDLHRMAGEIDTTICAGDTWSYNDLSDLSFDYLWQEFNQDIIAQTPNIDLTEAGGYILSVTDGACTTVDSIMINLQALPQLSLQDSVQACQGETISIDATTGMATYVWNTTDITPSIDVTQNGIYTVTAIENDCPAVDSTVATFFALPDATLPADRGICDGDSITLSFSDALPGYTWQSPIGMSTAQEFTASLAGEYIVLVTNAENCTASDTFNLSVNPTPVFDLPDTLGLCDGASQPLTANFSNMPDMIRWSTADQNPSIIVRTSNAGQLYLDASISNANGMCAFSDTTFVRVQSIPDVDLPDMASICSDSILVVDATTPGVSYLWSTMEMTPTIEITTEGTYGVIVDINGCTDEDSIIVETRQAPEVFLGMDTTICSGEMLTLTTGNNTYTTTWSTGATSSSIDVNGGELYSVMVEENGCFDSDDIFVDTAAIPVFDLGEDISICNQTGTMLSVDIPNVTIEWSTGETSPSITTTMLGDISATATSSDGCVFEDQINLSERTCVRFEIYRPNAFSPNAIMDPDNTVFKISPANTAIILSYDLKIFNRWGNLMFTSLDPNDSWDGLTNGEGSLSVTPGVYTYVLEITYSDDFDTNRTDILHGNVTLLN